MHSNSPSARSLSASTPPTVLIIDDEPAVGRALLRRLRGRGRIIVANSGAEALALVETQPADVVIADQYMPGMTGIEVLARMEQLCPDATRVLLTGQPSLQLMTRSATFRPIQRVLFKPCPIEEIDALLGGAPRAEPVAAPRARRAVSPAVLAFARRRVHRASLPRHEALRRQDSAPARRADAAPAELTVDDRIVVMPQPVRWGNAKR